MRNQAIIGCCNRGRWWTRLATLALLGTGVSGCAGFWDDVTSRDFHVKSLWTRPNPLVVLRDSNDGDKRAAALRSLREPSQHGGSEQEQDLVIRTLTAAATTERQPLCRLAAIDALGSFKDPRATQALKDAYYNAGNFNQGPAIADGVYTSGGPSPEMMNRIQCQALRSLGQTANPAAVDLLARVVREPRPEADQEAQFVMDRRIAAARALATFHDPQGEQALVEVLAREKDVALRDRAHESLKEATGQNLPPDANTWATIVGSTRPGGSPRPPQTSQPPVVPTAYQK